MALKYAVQRLLETHEVLLERDEAAQDAFGSETKRNWQPYLTTKGLFWWWPGRGKGGFKEIGDPERDVELSGGGLLVKPELVISEDDRVGSIIRTADGVEVPGPFRITSIRQHRTHKEISLQRP